MSDIFNKFSNTGSSGTIVLHSKNTFETAVIFVRSTIILILSIRTITNDANILFKEIFFKSLVFDLDILKTRGIHILDALMMLKLPKIFLLQLLSLRQSKKNQVYCFFRVCCRINCFSFTRH